MRVGKVEFVLFVTIIISLLLLLNSTSVPVVNGEAEATVSFPIVMRDMCVPLPTITVTPVCVTITPTPTTTPTLTGTPEGNY